MDKIQETKNLIRDVNRIVDKTFCQNDELKCIDCPFKTSKQGNCLGCKLDEIVDDLDNILNEKEKQINKEDLSSIQQTYYDSILRVLNNEIESETIRETTILFLDLLIDDIRSK